MRGRSRFYELSRQGADLDYSDGGEVERDVRQFLVNQHPRWVMRSEISLRLGCAVGDPLEKVLLRLARKGDVQAKNENGKVYWRAR